MTKRTQDFNSFMPNHVDLNKARYRRLRSGRRGVSEHLSRSLPGFLKTEMQGSFALGTIIRPTRGREYDLDMLVFMESVRSKASKDYIEEVHRAMMANKTYADKVKMRKRCVEINYAGEFHMDIVPCVKKRDGLYICNRQTGHFEITDGTGFKEWFNGKNAGTHGNLKRAARLLKYLRDHKRTFTAPSVLLTTLIGNAVRDDDDGSEFKTLPDALKTVMNRVNVFLQANRKQPRISNPALPRREYFSRNWNPAMYRNFRNMFASYARRINQAFDESDHARSVTAWRGLFGNDFGRAS